MQGWKAKEVLEDGLSSGVFQKVSPALEDEVFRLKFSKTSRALVRPVGSVRQCVSKAEAEGVPAGTQEVVSRTGGGFKMACFRFAGHVSSSEWATGGGCTAVVASRVRKSSRVGRWASRRKCSMWLTMGTRMEMGAES